MMMFSQGVSLKYKQLFTDCYRPEEPFPLKDSTCRSDPVISLRHVKNKMPSTKNILIHVPAWHLPRLLNATRYDWPTTACRTCTGPLVPLRGTGVAAVARAGTGRLQTTRAGGSEFPSSSDEHGDLRDSYNESLYYIPGLNPVRILSEMN